MTSVEKSGIKFRAGYGNAHTKIKAYRIPINKRHDLFLGKCDHSFHTSMLFLVMIKETISAVTSLIKVILLYLLLE
jgi:peptide subunit release factor 1 (eRF1)